MLIVTWRTSNTYAQNHIVAPGVWSAFCGSPVPQAIREVWDDPRNPYNRGTVVTCPYCVEEWNLGRREGFRNDVPAQTESESDKEG